MTNPRYRCTVLTVDDEPAVLALLGHQIGRDFDVLTAGSADQAKRLLERKAVDIVVTDLTLPDASGIQFLDWVYQNHPRIARVLITGTAKLQDAADAINNCHIDRMILKPWRGEDLLAHLKDVARSLLLERSHEALMQELEQRVQERTQELRAKNQILEKMALTDPLTGLPNRRAIDLIARQEVLRRSRVASPLCIGLIDADRFKQINSDHLLCGGDHVLCWLARMLQRSIRGSDAIGRVGGEEFMLVAPDTGPIGADALADRVRTAIADSSTDYNGSTIRITVSAGFAIADEHTNVTFERLRETAAAALAEAKATGRNRSVVRTLSADVPELAVPLGSA